MPKTLKNSIIIFTIIIATFTMAHFALAVDFGFGYATNLGLGTADPRVIAVNIIRIALTFLGIIAVCIIIYAGFLWMTAAGRPERIDKAKKTLIGAIIGLIIILSAWAIVAFIINRMAEIVTPGPTCTPACVAPAPKCCTGNFCCADTDSCCGAACCPVGMCCCSGVCQACPCSPPAAFVAIAIQPPEAFCPIGGNTTIRNSVIRIYFNKNVDPASVDANSIVIQASNTQCPAGALAPVAGDFTVIGKRVEFRPAVGTCPANPCSADRCFDADSTIDIEVMTAGMNRVETFAGEQAQDNLALNEHPQFFTNDLIDCQDPTVTLNSDPQVCLGIPNDLGSVSSDDSGVSQIEFSDNNGNAAFGGAPVVVPCPGPGPCGQLPPGPAWTLPLGTAIWLPTIPAYSAGTNYTITATADDLNDNSASDSQTFTLRPDHCCNNIIDGDETGVDCGGSCAVCSGAACGVSFSETCAGDPDPNCDDSRCASGFCSCISHATDAECTAKGYDTGITNCCLCQDKPIIDWVTPIGGFCDDDINMPCQEDADCATTCNTDTPNGAEGNFVTIGGRNFGTSTGAVYFSDATSDPDPGIAAQFPSVVNPVCADTWTDNQVIVVVPNGADVGAIRIVEASTGNNYEDRTDNAYGDFINDFVVNTIERPGLCQLNPDNGVMNDTITYDGIRLSVGSSINFGDFIAGYAEALNFNFNSATNVQADVPNIETGNITSFVINNVLGIDIVSNYLNFTKNPEAVSGPYITSFEPIEGSESQYVTIYGSGFGATKGISTVHFGDELGPEVSYDFPDVCADSVWSDNQIIVKVPAVADNNYTITMVIGGSDIINTDDLSPNQFNVDSSLDLAPSACKIQPIMGPNNSPVSLWGEYFGPQATGLVRFLLNHDQSGAAITFWGPDGDADKAETTVHQDAVSGPVRIVQSGLEGNGLNFTIGFCTDAPDPDTACGTDICCPVGSTEEGRCHAIIDDCYITVTSSVYEWDFSTAGPTVPGDPCYVDPVATPFCTPTSPACAVPQFCDPATCTCQLPYVESCMGYGLGECADNLCPNSPGNCSPYAGGGTVIVGDCDNAECVSRFGAGYTYNILLNKCIDGSACDLPKSVLDGLGNPIIAYCADYGGAGRWHVDTSISCPVGWSSIGGNQCIEDFPAGACTLCVSGTCMDDGVGACGIDQDICPTGSNCNAGQCEAIDSATCECCCRIGFAAQDCCVPLDCTGECGTDRIVDIDEFGYCTGCALAADPDDACNCLGSSGKYCDSSDPEYPTGVCRDCAQLSTTAECGLHNTTCCTDAMNSDSCRGGDGTLVLTDPGYCAYYDCDIADPSICDITASTAGSYKDIPSCTAGCGAEPLILPGLSCYDSDTNFCELVCSAGTTCLGDSGCLDMNPAPPPPACVAGDTSCLCCCDPFNDECNLINPVLTCTPDSDPCTTASRGLCCDCSQDSDCVTAGPPNIIGCGYDGCCRNRPQVISTTPPDEPAVGSDNVCRNSVITATFDQEMDISSFSGKVVVIGDYGSEQCPEGTEFLVKNDADFDRSKNIFARIYHKIAGAIKRLFEPISRLAKAYTPVLPTNNYCAITGTVSGYNNAAGEGVLTFSPSQLFDENQRYYAIIKGDSDITDDISEGVLNNWDISMNGPHTETFNARTYTNSYIWSFETGTEICELSYITIDPLSYLFQTAYDTQTFQAEPKNANGQTITGIPGVYDWSWSWLSDNTSVVQVTAQATPNEHFGNATSQNVKDGKTYIKAIAAITEDTVMDPSTVGQTKQGKAQVYVFLCENPWPPVDSLTGIWNPWIDEIQGANCLVGTGNCPDTKFELYYCRDDGGAGTADDYPAILSGAGDQIIRGDSLLPDILKEIYYLREGAPDSATGLTVSDGGIGGSVTAQWPDDFAVLPDPDIIGYKLYYGTGSGSYDNDIELERGVTAGLNCNGVICNYQITGLTNNTTYYFVVTSYYGTGAESEYSNEEDEAPTDSTAPAVPVNFVAIAGDGQADLSWDANVDDTVGYRVYYGTTAGIYGDSQDVGDVNGAMVAGLTNGQRYYFVVTAYDDYDNESGYSLEENSMSFAAPTNLIATASSTDNTAVDLSWSLDSAGVNDVNIYWGTVSGGPYANSDSLAGYGTSYQATGLNNDTDYYLIVKSENVDGEESIETNEAHTKTFP